MSTTKKWRSRIVTGYMWKSSKNQTSISSRRILTISCYPPKGRLRTFLLCPTRQSNDLYSNLKLLSDKDCCKRGREHVLQAIEHIVKHVKDDWNTYKMEQWPTQLYHKWLHCPHTLTLQEESLLDYWQKDSLRSKPNLPTSSLSMTPVCTRMEGAICWITSWSSTDRFHSPSPC